MKTTINKTKTFFAITALAVLTTTAITSCSTPAEKVEDAKIEVNDADKNLDEANEAYFADIENYRKETDARIAANNQSIDDFNKRIENEKKEAKADYKIKIAELKQKNSDMKKKMDDYKAEGKDKWESFKKEFNSDMDELGNALNDFTVKNTK